MAKYRRYRKYTRRNYPKWAANIRQASNTSTIEPSSTFYLTEVLATNPSQANSGVSQVFTVKNVEISFTFESSTSLSQVENICAYIMYVPQGMAITANFVSEHPEYILNYKYLGSPTPDSSQNFQPITVKSRLARKLQTGDSVVLLLFGFNVGSSSATVEYHGVVRWWTRAN